MTTLQLDIEKTPLERYVPPAKPSLVGLTRDQLAEALGAVGVAPAQQKMRVQQLWHWIYVRGAQRFEQMTSVSKELRSTLDAHYTLARPEVVAEQGDLKRAFQLSQEALTAGRAKPSTGSGPRQDAAAAIPTSAEAQPRS